MLPDAIAQHLSVAKAIRRLVPAARFVAAFHHSPDSATYAARCGSACPPGWIELRARLEDEGVECVDISGGLERMEKLYSAADLHVGYRVHAHVLMTSWRKPSVLIAEDGRGSGMSDVISGRVFPAWRKKSARMLPLPRSLCPPRFVRSRKCFDMELADRLARHIAGMEGRIDNAVKTDASAMAAWFAQFRGKGG